MNEIETNPLIRRLLTDREGMERIREYFSEEERDQHRRESISYFLPYIEEWHEEGKIKGSNPEVTANAVRSISLLTLHQDDIGESYDEVRNLVIEAFAAGLTED